jgi:hypothetical protein
MLDLRVADFVRLCRQPGCPLCAARRQAEQRYIEGVLWEGVNDGHFRAKLKRSLGFCPEHAWVLQATEDTHWRDGLGTASIYHDLARHILEMLPNQAQNGPAPFRSRLRRWLAQLRQRLWPTAPAARLLAQLAPRQPCPVCRTGQGAEKRIVNILLDAWQMEEVQAAFSASAGLCLPHLRQALARADQKATAFLVETTAKKLDQLAADLAEYERQHAWRFRDEPKVEREEQAWVRAVAFFAGEAVEPEAERVYLRRRHALEIFHIENQAEVAGEQPPMARGGASSKDSPATYRDET